MLCDYRMKGIFEILSVIKYSSATNEVFKIESEYKCIELKRFSHVYKVLLMSIY